MKKVKEFIMNFFNNNPLLAVILIIASVTCLLEFSGFLDWHHRFVELFWKGKKI